MSEILCCRHRVRNARCGRYFSKYVVPVIPIQQVRTNIAAHDEQVGVAIIVVVTRCCPTREMLYVEDVAIVHRVPDRKIDAGSRCHLCKLLYRWRRRRRRGPARTAAAGTTTATGRNAETSQSDHRASDYFL